LLGNALADLTSWGVSTCTLAQGRDGATADRTEFRCVIPEPVPADCFVKHGLTYGKLLCYGRLGPRS
jgi:hypothetical protein